MNKTAGVGETASWQRVREGYGLEAFLAVRGRFHLLYRLTVRLAQVAATDGGARTVSWRLLLLACVLLDVGLWAALRDPGRLGMRTRLAIDSIDIAVWSLAPYPAGTPYILAVLIGFPLALEAGLRWLWGGLVVPGVALAVTASVRYLAGRAIDPLEFLWLVLGVVSGVLLRRYMSRLEDSTEAQWRQRCSAEHRRAFLAGQNSVAMGASSAVDAIESVLPVLGEPKQGTVLWELAHAWKPSLAKSTSDEAAYLGHALASWATLHNRHPDLASLVQINLAEGIGTTLLTRSQEEALCKRLSLLDLRGLVQVQLDDPNVSDRPPGGPLRFLIGTHIVDLPADPNRPPRPYDPGPAAFVMAMFLMIADTVLYPISSAIVLPSMVLTAGAAWWAHARLLRIGRSARGAIMVIAEVVAIVYVVSATVGLGHPVNTGGTVNYPVVAPLDLVAILAGMYWDDLGAGLRLTAAACAAAVVGSAWLFHPVTNDLGDLGLQAFWAIPIFVCSRRLASELDTSRLRYAEALLEEDETVAAAAFTDGRNAVIALVRRARNEVRQRLSEVRGSLPSGLVGTVHNRLGEVDRCLARWDDRGESSSSTTTT